MGRARTSPTSRILRLLRSEGFEAAVVERRLPFCRTTVDALGAFDLIAVRADVSGVLGAQVTRASNHAAGRSKLLGHSTLVVSRFAEVRFVQSGADRRAQGT